MLLTILYYVYFRALRFQLLSVYKNRPPLQHTACCFTGNKTVVVKKILDINNKRKYLYTVAVLFVANYTVK